MASKVILVNNHPSGKLEASKSDIKITKQIKESLGLIDVLLLDHLIITEDCYNFILKGNELDFATNIS
jgi:DNA repair protein RadC